MSAELVVGLVVWLGIVAAGVGQLLTSRAWLYRRRTRRVIVHTTTDQSIDGLLIHVGRDGLVLRDARFLGSEAAPAAGELFVPRERVGLVQQP